MGHPHSVLAGDRCGAPGVPDAGTVSTFLGPCPGGGCRQGRPDHLDVVEPKARWNPLV